MSRDFDQIIRSRETDSWHKTFHRYIGTALGGTATMTVSADSGREQIFITGLSMVTNIDGGHLHLGHGTSIMYHMYFYDDTFSPGGVGGSFKDSFETPLKVPQGTALNIMIMGLFGTHCVNVNGYKVK